MVLYAFFTLQSPSANRAFTRNFPIIQLYLSRCFGEKPMSFVDAVSLALTLGLFGYLLVALLRADEA